MPDLPCGLGAAEILLSGMMVANANTPTKKVNLTFAFMESSIRVLIEARNGGASRVRGRINEQLHEFLLSPRVRKRVGTSLARDLAQVVSESIFDVPRLVEAARHQRLDPLLGSRSPERSDARIPPGAELDVRRQAGVDEPLGLGDRPFIELGDPGRERFYKRI